MKYSLTNWVEGNSIKLCGLFVDVTNKELETIYRFSVK